HGRAAQIAHFLSGARKVDAGSAAIDIADQAAAIETTVGRVAAPAVRRADQAERTEKHILGNTWHGVRGSGFLNNWRRRWLTGTGGQQRKEDNKRETGQVVHRRAVQANEP